MTRRATKADYQDAAGALLGVILGSCILSNEPGAKNPDQVRTSMLSLLDSLEHRWPPEVSRYLHPILDYGLENLDAMTAGMRRADQLAGDSKDPKEIANAANIGAAFMRKIIAGKGKQA